MRTPGKAPNADGIDSERLRAQPSEHPSPPARFLLSLQRAVGNRAVRQLMRRSPAPDEPQSAPRGDTGLPDELKSGVESLSGMSLDAVRVHYNSSQPSDVDAHAFTQGTDIHVAPGQERHLPHEAWHAVQQAQGRVQPTGELRGAVPVNDDLGLEQEAEAMGAKASATPAQRQPGQRSLDAVVAQLGTPIQRVLAHTHPIVAVEVASVRRIPGKLVFILDGGANGIVVVKFETVGRATESVARFADRQTALRAIAAQVLQNVPGASSLTAADMGTIAQINAAGGADLADLKMMADGVLNTRQGFDRLLALKMENINVGQNLEDMVKAAAQAAAAAPPPALVAGAGGRVRAPAPVQGPAPIVRHDSPLWQEFGKMAAFDLLVSNNDRFRPEGVNLQNVDLHGTQGVSLDVVDPNTPLRTPDTWEGEAIFRAPTTWALNTVGGMCDTLGVNRLYVQTVLNAFLTGFQLAKAQLKAQEQQYRAQGMTLAGHGQAAAGSPTYAVIARRLHKI